MVAHVRKGAFHVGGELVVVRKECRVFVEFMKPAVGISFGGAESARHRRGGKQSGTAAHTMSAPGVVAVAGCVVRVNAK